MKGLSHLKNRWKRLSDNTTLEVKLKQVFILFFIIPLFLFTGVSYLLTNRLILNQTINSMSQTYNETIGIFDRFSYNMSDIVKNLLSNPEVFQNIVGLTEQNTMLEQQANYHALIRKFSYVEQITGVDKIRLYIKNEDLVVGNEVDLISIDEVESQEWFQQIKESEVSRYWVLPNYIKNADGSDSPYFSYLGMLYHPDVLSAPVGMLRVDISASRITEMMKRLQFNPEVSVFLADQDKLIYHLSGEKIDFDRKELSKPEIKIGQHNWDLLKYHQQSYIVRSQRISTTDWYLVVMLPRSSIFHNQETLYLAMLIGLFIVSLVSYFMAYYTIKSSVKRIFALNKAIKEVESGNFSPQITPAGKDEIGELMSSFQTMTTRMEEMINERYHMGQEVKNAELSALQAQINPHFLYNSLDLVNCLAIQHDMPEIVEMITNLVDFYKLSLNRGKELLTIHEELLHVQAYVKIQNLRFGKAIDLKVKEEPWMKEYSILKIILQPIVENSIMHGILEKEDSTGEITIEPIFKGDRIEIIVKDDGVGMSKEQFKEMFKERENGQKSGYGVRNINERLALYYGPNYGLQFESKEGRGTKVAISIPAIPYHAK